MNLPAQGSPMPRHDGRRHQQVGLGEVDYPGANYWVPARNVLPRHGAEIRFIVIHITGGPALHEGNAINTFRTGAANAHYIVNRRGSITQMVRDQDIANHVDSIHSATNRHSIGIEHVNPWRRDQHMTPTAPQYAASARLVAWLAKTYNIPVIHRPVRGTFGIRGHQEEQPNTRHNCPGPGWDWQRYMSLVRGAMGETSTFEETILDLARDPFRMGTDSVSDWLTG